MRVYTGYPSECTKEKSQQTNKSIKVSGHMINIKRSAIFLYTSNEQLEIDISTSPFTWTPKSRENCRCKSNTACAISVCVKPQDPGEISQRSVETYYVCDSKHLVLLGQQFSPTCLQIQPSTSQNPVGFCIKIYRLIFKHARKGKGTRIVKTIFEKENYRPNAL